MHCAENQVRSGQANVVSAGLCSTKHFDANHVRSQKCSRSHRECVYTNRPADVAPEHAAAIAWASSIDSLCQAWKESGDVPFPRLTVPSSLDWEHLDARGLRYFHYLASVGQMLDNNNTRKYCLWWKIYDV
jgi:hypothetical protein